MGHLGRSAVSSDNFQITCTFHFSGDVDSIWSNHYSQCEVPNSSSSSSTWNLKLRNALRRPRLVVPTSLQFNGSIPVISWLILWHRNMCFALNFELAPPVLIWTWTFSTNTAYCYSLVPRFRSSSNLLACHSSIQSWNILEFSLKLYQLQGFLASWSRSWQGDGKIFMPREGTRYAIQNQKINLP